MGIFGNSIEVKNPSKTTYSQDDLKKIELNYQKEFLVEKGKNVHSALRKDIPLAIRTQIREYAFEKILDDGMYNFKHILVVPNPYGASFQTVMLLFVTKEEVACRYTIFDENGEEAFSAEDIIGTRHRVPIMLLFPEKTNKLKLELLNRDREVVKERPLTIYVREVPDRVRDIFKPADMSGKSSVPYTLINGTNFNPIAIDENLNIRYIMQLRTTKTGMIPLSNGHFLLPDKNSNTLSANGEKYSCNFYELDYMGRIYKSYIFKYPFGKVFASEEERFYFLTSKDKGYENDWIVCFDMNSGEVVKEFSIAKIIGDKHKTCPGWIKVTRIELDDNFMIIVLKNLHTIIKVDFENEKLIWAIGPKDFWAGTPVEKALLTRLPIRQIDDNEVEDLEYVYPSDVKDLKENAREIVRPVYTEILEKTADEKKEALVIYSTQFKLDEEIDDDNVEETQSLVTTILIDSSNGSYLTVNAFLTKQFYRNGTLLVHKVKGEKDKKNIIAYGGLAGRQGQKIRGNIAEFDLETSERVRRIAVKKVFNNAWEFIPNIAEYCSPIQADDNVIIGDPLLPVKIDEDIKETTEKKLPKRFFGNTSLSAGMFLFSIRTKAVDAVYLKGEKATYMADYSQIKKRSKRETFMINVHGLPVDDYFIYVKCNNEIYMVKDEIRVEKS